MRIRELKAAEIRARERALQTKLEQQRTIEAERIRCELAEQARRKREFAEREELKHVQEEEGHADETKAMNVAHLQRKREMILAKQKACKEH